MVGPIGEAVGLSPETPDPPVIACAGDNESALASAGGRRKAMLFAAPPSRASRRIFLAMGTAWVLTAVCPSASGQQIRFPGAVAPEGASEDPYNVYLPTDRTLSRGMSRARERLAEREYNEALAFLQRVLDQEEDTFLGEPSDAKSRRGLKATARGLIANLPPAGREMYELLHATGARRQLEAALSSGDREELRRLVRRYMFTPSGFEAAMILAQMEFDRGHPLSAAYIYQQLTEDTRGAARYEPQLSLLAAISWTAAGQTDRAAATLRDLAERFDDTEIELAGRKARLPSARESDADLVAWLTQSVGAPEVAVTGGQDWLMHRGAASRNAQHAGGAPHLSTRWRARVVNDPRFETFLTSRSEQFQQQGIAAIPAARPIAVGDAVLMRTPQNVVAVDWRTGKRMWETREEETGLRERYLAEFMSGDVREEWPMLSHPLEQRVWDDSLTMSLSSDGERVFAIGGMSLAHRDEQAGWGMAPAFGGAFDFTAAPTNRLTAYELATEGKLAWEIDGAGAADELAGAFFLGPPLAVDGSLYVLAEVRSAVYLLALEPRTGRLEWQQQLAGLELGITLDPQRRLSGASPSQTAGIVICPTSAGIVVAVDVIQREFAWVYRYPRQVESFINFRQGWQGRPEASVVRDNNRWLDGTPIVADGRVYLTPPDSAELHCLDLNTGELVWKQPREKALYVACVDGGNVVLVGVDSVTAVRAVDRTPAWAKERVELPAGVLPAGVGYLSQGRYYLPLSSGQVLAIDTQDGTTSGGIGSSTEAAVGNLICHRGSVLSQAALVLDKYDQIEVLRRRAEAALAANPRDAAAIRDLAEMRHLDGELAEAVAMLKQALDIEPDDPLTREMLADCLLAAMAEDYSAYAGDLPLLRQLVSRPEQRIELLRIEATGLEASGKTMEAFAALVRLAEATAAEPLELTLGPGHTARSDCWIRARVGAIWTGASADERATIADQLARWRADWAGAPARSQMCSYLAHFDGVPGADEVRLLLARDLLDQRDLLDAEMELLKLERSPTKEYQAAAAVLMTQLLLVGDRIEEARRLAASLEDRWPDAPVFDGKTPQQLLDEWHFELTGSGDETARGWPRGRVTAEVQPAASRRDTTRRAANEYQQGFRRLRVEQLYRRPAGGSGADDSAIGWPLESARLGAAQWLIAQDGTRLVGRNGAGRDVFKFNAERETVLRRFPGNSEWVQAAQLGDLLCVTLGGQILALDTRRPADDDEDVLWQAYPAGRFPAIPARANVPRAWSRQAGPTIYHPSWTDRKRPPGPTAMLMGSLGPVTPYGAVFQEQLQLRCVDPLSGETRWTRTDIPAACELFGDDELLLAASFGESQIYVIRFADGTLVERREMPSTPWLHTAGRNVCQLIDKPSGRGVRKIVRVVDAASGEQLWKGEYGPMVRMTTIEPNLVAVVEPPDRTELARLAGTEPLVDVPGANAIPQGRFQLIDVAAGRVRIDQPLPDVAVPRGLHVLVSGSQLFLCVNTDVRQQPSRPIGLDYPLVDGQVYAFDLETGRAAWPGPAVVERRGIMLAQPLDIPLLMFADRQLKRDAGGGKSQLRLLCLDKATGTTVYRNDGLPDTGSGHFQVRAANGEPRAVEIEMSARTVRLSFSDRPRAPEPPANDRVEAPRKSLGRGLWGVTQRMGDAIQGAIENPAANPWQEADQPELDDD